MDLTIIVVFILIACAGAVLVIFDIIFSRIKNVSYTVESDKISEPFRAVFISDFHNGNNGSKILAMINKISPDVVFIGGDLADKYSGCRRSMKFANDLACKYRVFFAPGNHEYDYRDGNSFIVSLRNMGITVLEDGVCPVCIGKNYIQICGVYDGIKLSDKSAGTQLSHTNDISDKNVFRILLAHFPIFLKSYCKFQFDLILAGHEHGGIIRIPGVNNGLIGHRGLNPKFAGGIYRCKNSSMIVSRGVCYPYYNFVVPRIFNNPEVITIEFREKL